MAAELLPEVTKFIDAPKVVIGGTSVEAVSGDTFGVTDPSTARPITQVPRGTAADIDAAVAAAREAFAGRRWSGLPPAKRAEILSKVGDLIMSNVNELAQIEAIDSGKALSFATAEIVIAAEVFRYYSGWPTKFFGETLPSDDSMFIYSLREPVGVCGGIIPWNFPLIMACWKVAPALAFGNTVVLKPASRRL